MKTRFKHCLYRAIVNNRLSALVLALTPNIGHYSWANDVTLSNIHKRSLFLS